MEGSTVEVGDGGRNDAAFELVIEEGELRLLDSFSRQESGCS